ncbi:hypothetical protein PLACP1_19410 [Planifilum fimeticola]
MEWVKDPSGKKGKIVDPSEKSLFLTSFGAILVGAILAAGGKIMDLEFGWHEKFKRERT